VPDLNSLALKSWDRVGAAGSWLVLGAPEDQLSMAAYRCWKIDQAATASVRRADICFERERGNDGMERRREIGILRVEARQYVFAADQCLASTLQPLGNGAGALRRGRPTHSHRCVREKNRFAAEAERHCSAMRALRDGAVYMKANKAGSIQVIQKISKLNDKQVAERSYDILKEDVVTDPRIPAEVIHQSIKLAARSDGRVKNVDISKAVDLGVANRIMESGK